MNSTIFSFLNMSAAASQRHTLEGVVVLEFLPQLREASIILENRLTIFLAQKEHMQTLFCLARNRLALYTARRFAGCWQRHDGEAGFMEVRGE